jgi:hypothetical protein
MLRREYGRRHETMTGHAETMTAWVGGIAGCMSMRQPLSWSGTSLRGLGYQGELKQRRVCCRNDLWRGTQRLETVNGPPWSGQSAFHELMTPLPTTEHS